MFLKYRGYLIMQFTEMLFSDYCLFSRLLSHRDCYDALSLNKAISVKAKALDPQSLLLQGT